MDDGRLLPPLTRTINSLAALLQVGVLFRPVNEVNDEQKCLRKLMRLADLQHQRHQALENNPGAWEIQGGSPLAGDEAKTHPFPVGPAAWHALTVAQDHLLCLHSSLHAEPDHVLIHTHAQFTLIRAGLENAARAVWLLGPKDRATRVTRRLAMQRNEVRAAYKMRELIGDPGRRTKQEALQKLDAILAAALGVPVSEAETMLKRTPASYKDMVRGAGPVAGIPADTVEVIWSAGSALAHGDTHGTLSVLDKEVSRTRSVKDNDMAIARVTGSISGLYMTAVVAAAMLNTAYALYQQRARAPFAA